MDRLAVLLDHFAFTADSYHQGAFCGVSRHEDGEATGQVHLLRGGRLSFETARGERQDLIEPSLMLVIRPRAHQLSTPDDSPAELVCASLAFRGGPDNPLTRALPDYLVSPLRQLPGLAASADWLFAEAFGDNCGRGLVLNRLFELMIIQLLRQLLTRPSATPGMLAGLADRRLARALTALHERPHHAWTVAELAGLAGMSRAGFAAHFQHVVGSAPGDYLTRWRIALAQQRLQQRRPLALIADEVGYESPSALARAFRRITGASPTEWQRAQA